MSAFGPFKSVPRVDIRLDREVYRPGDLLRASVTVHTDRPGMSVRRAVIELVLENRYTHVRTGQTLDVRSYGNIGGAGNPLLHSPFRSGSITEERVDRIVMCQERLFTDGVIRHRTETAELRCEIKPPPVRRTMERRATYMVSVHFDLPRMRDVEAHRSVPVQIT